MRRWAGLIVVAGIVLAPMFAQEKAGSNEEAAIYDVGREVTLIGTVQTFTAAAQTPPLGAHLMLQTSSGVVDVHVGDARLLRASQFTIQSGDTLRVVGETLDYGKGTQFVARLLQKGTQVLAVRSVRGFPLSYMAPRNAAASKPAGGGS
ncbi:MAG: hypothetical protein WBR26_05470 [Candidatus Acidiferrum sp.]